MSVRSFCLVALLFGSLFVFVVPPFQVADEFNHFYRAWQVSDGIFVGVRTADNRLGGDLPVAVAKITQPFRSLPFHSENQIKSNTIFYNLSVPLDENNRQFVDFANTAIYAPTAYVPQAVAISIGKFLKLGPLSIFYFSRFLTLLFWLSMVYASLKILPIHRNLFVGLALLPSSLFINASASGDVVTNACSFFFIALCVKMMSEKKRLLKQINLIGIGLLFLTSLIMSLNKVAYFPLVFLFFLIKKEHVNGLKNKITLTTALIVTNLTAIVFWSKTIQPIYLKFEDYNPLFRVGQQLNENVDPSVQMQFILHNPLYFSKIATFSLLKTLPHTLIHYIGKFGWEKNYLPLWLIAIILLLLIIQTVFSKNNNQIDGSIKEFMNNDSLAFTTPKALNVNNRRCNLRESKTRLLNSEGVERQHFMLKMKSDLHIQLLRSWRHIWQSIRRFHLRLFTFNPFGIVNKSSFTNASKPNETFNLTPIFNSKFLIFNSKDPLSIKAKFGLFGIGILTTYSFAAAMYGIWCPIGSNFIENLGGKYFIPIYPLFFLALPTYEIKTSSRFETSTTLKCLIVLAQPKVLFYILQLSLTWSVVQVVIRYYG